MPRFDDFFRNRYGMPERMYWEPMYGQDPMTGQDPMMQGGQMAPAPRQNALRARGRKMGMNALLQPRGAPGMATGGPVARSELMTDAALPPMFRTQPVQMMPAQPEEQFFRRGPIRRSPWSFEA